MKKIVFSFLTVFFVVNFYSANEKESSTTETTMHHIKDSHEFPVFGDAFILHLPVILWTDNGVVCFSSECFNGDDSGKVIVEKDGQRFVKYHESIYYANENIAQAGALTFEDEHPVNKSPLDFSITRNVFSMFLSMAFILLVFCGAARTYSRKTYSGVPQGIASFVEPLVVFIRDEVAIPNIGRKKYKKYLPYLLTVFFFIWINNIFGLIPFFPFGSNLTGNIAFTCTMAVFTFIVTTLSGNKNYWKHIFWTPGVPVPMKIFLAPIEIIGMFTKPISLMIRLFSNITAGHIIIISLISLIFIFKTYFVSPVSIAFAVFISVIEVLVTAIQAYIFTMLSSLYIGTAVAEDEH